MPLIRLMKSFTLRLNFPKCCFANAETLPLVVSLATRFFECNSLSLTNSCQASDTKNGFISDVKIHLVFSSRKRSWGQNLKARDDSPFRKLHFSKTIKRLATWEAISSKTRLHKSFGPSYDLHISR